MSKNDNSGRFFWDEGDVVVVSRPNKKDKEDSSSGDEPSSNPFKSFLQRKKKEAGKESKPVT